MDIHVIRMSVWADPTWKEFCSAGCFQALGMLWNGSSLGRQCIFFFFFLERDVHNGSILVW